MKYQAQWKVPDATGDKVWTHATKFDRWADAQADADDVSGYVGTVAWVERIVENGEVPPSRGISVAPNARSRGTNFARRM